MTFVATTWAPDESRWTFPFWARFHICTDGSQSQAARVPPAPNWRATWSAAELPAPLGGSAVARKENSGGGGFPPGDIAKRPAVVENRLCGAGRLATRW